MSCKPSISSVFHTWIIFLLLQLPSQSFQLLPTDCRKNRITTAEPRWFANVNNEAESKSSVPNVKKVDSMPEPLSCDLKNTYYLLRHGQSTANVDEIISSSRSLAYTDIHCLTDFGYQQGKDSAEQLLDILEQNAQPGEQVVLISSPFARARETAEACLNGLKERSDRVEQIGIKIVPEYVLHDNLVERYFGRLDKEAIYTYAYVWPLDRFDVLHTAFDVESVAAVCHRIRETVEDLEEKYENSHLVWISHADVLQIAQLYAADAENIGEFSSYRFKNGEVREMIIGSCALLPDPVPLQPPKRGTGM